MTGRDQTSTTFVPLRRAAGQLGVPVSWLRAEAQAGRVAHLRTGRRLRFNVEAVSRQLTERITPESSEGRRHD